ncbi:MAG: hypothetical protein QNK18_16770 [Gammaproteobacteria bacterium]|nr:hypothetical protein [Gammaproteobacteria bacterium]MDJ0892831.1 hypothetical protein [Gammaproteobacteria bacterium]
MNDVSLLDIVFVLVTGFVAYHGLTHRNEDGENDIGHMLFGSIALLFCLRVLFVDIFKVF